MSRLISDFLEAEEPDFTNYLRQLEQQSGYPRVDVYLTTDIAKRTRDKLRELGLDPSDTNGRELYHALQSLATRHDNFLSQALGAAPNSGPEELTAKTIDFVKNQKISTTCWALKHSVAKRLLRANPPKQIMKQLNYRSIDSLVKREDVDEVFAALRFVESQSWLQKFVASYKKLQPSDFEARQIKLISLKTSRWGAPAEDFAYRQHSHITCLKEMGVIGFLPMPSDVMPGFTLTTLLLTFHFINEIRVFSSFLKLVQVKPNFGQIVASTLGGQPATDIQIGGQPLQWRTIVQHFGTKADKDHPEVFEPHLQPDDLKLYDPVEFVYRLEPALQFWSGAGHLGQLSENRPVSFNIMDNAVNLANQLPYGFHTTQNFQSDLWSELVARYLRQKPLEDQVLDQLDKELETSDLAYLQIEEFA